LQAFVGDNSANIVFGTSNQDGSGITQSLPIASVGASNINIMITASYMV